MTYYNSDPKPPKKGKKKPQPLKRTAIKKTVNTDSIPDLIKQATTVFNAWIRKRDEIYPCISCNDYFILQAGHFHNAKNNPELRFNEYNVNGQCEKCNCFKDGNHVEYRKGLIKRIGKLEVDKLDLAARSYKAKSNFKWDREFLKGIIKKYA